MSCLLCDHADSMPYTVVDVFGQGFTYKPGSAIEWAEAEIEESYDDDDRNK
jgi:hypothetical protein